MQRPYIANTVVEPGFEFMEANFKAHILNHQDGHSGNSAWSSSIEAQSWFALGRVCGPYHLLPLLLGIYQELQRKPSLLLGSLKLR